jgi:hypothetical protein
MQSDAKLSPINGRFNMLSFINVQSPHQTSLEIAYDNEAALDTANLLTLLTAIQQSDCACRAIDSLFLSACLGPVARGRAPVRQRLIESGRGRGTTLTDFASKLLWADRLVTARLSPTLDSLASELEVELGKTVEGKSERCA